MRLHSGGQKRKAPSAVSEVVYPEYIISNLRKTATSSKKRKASNGVTKDNSRSKDAKKKGKEKAYDRDFIPIPAVPDGEEEPDEEDVEFFRENLAAGEFLTSMDPKALSR
jgi:hypothetical protein